SRRLLPDDAQWRNGDAARDRAVPVDQSRPDADAICRNDSVLADSGAVAPDARGRRRRDVDLSGAARCRAAARRSASFRDVAVIPVEREIAVTTSGNRRIDRSRASGRAMSTLSILREIVREAFYGLYHHRFRAALSMLGISWGIISVVVLLAYG